MPSTPANLMANGPIFPSRFIRIDPSADFKGIASEAGLAILGVSQDGTNFPPLSDLITGARVAASIGQYFRYFGEGDVCLVETNESIIAGDQLKAAGTGDDTGRAATADTDNDQVGAVAIQSASGAGELIRCQVTPMRQRGS